MVVVVGPLDSSVRVSFLAGSFRFEVTFRAVPENADQSQEGRMERKEEKGRKDMLYLFSRRRTRPLSSSLPTRLLRSTPSRLLLVPLLLLYNVRRSSRGVIRCTPRFLLIPRSYSCTYSV